MLSRRVVLTGAAVVALSGCTSLSRPAPSIAPAPQADPLPGHLALRTLREALDAAAAGPVTDEQAGLVAWALDVTAIQYGAVSLPPPAPRTPTPTPTPASPSPTPPATPAAPDASVLVAALATASGAFAEQALDPGIARPLVWASMSAWAGATAAQLPAASASREPARGVRLPAPQEPVEAARDALAATQEVLYGLQTTAGASGLAAPEVAALNGRIAFWAGVRDDLAALIRAATATPTPASPWYRVTVPADAASARALVARLQASALPVLGRSLAHGPADLRPRLLTAIADAAADVPRWGGLLERWPGMPA